MMLGTAETPHAATSSASNPRPYDPAPEVRSARRRRVEVVEPPADGPDLACTLDPGAARAQLDAWADLRRWCRRAERNGDGVRLWFDAAAEPALRRVAEREAACCAFLQLEVVADPAAVRLSIRSEHPDAQPLIGLLAAQASGQSSTGRDGRPALRTD